METLEKRFQTDVEKFQNIQKDYQRLIKARQQLESQLTENKIVKEELDLLADDATVFKLLGPVLVKQELQEARANVQKRLDYITGEVKRYEQQMNDLNSKRDTVRDSLQKIQQQIQQQHVKTADRP